GCAVAVKVLLSIDGGYDVDGYAVWLAPVAIFTVVSLDFSRPGPPPRIWLYWFVLQAAAMEFCLPWFPDEAFYLSRFAAHATGPTLAYVTVFSWALIATVVAMQLGDQAPRIRPSGGDAAWRGRREDDPSAERHVSRPVELGSRDLAHADLDVVRPRLGRRSHPDGLSDVLSGRDIAR